MKVTFDACISGSWSLRKQLQSDRHLRDAERSQPKTQLETIGEDLQHEIAIAREVFQCCSCCSRIRANAIVIRASDIRSVALYCFETEVTTRYTQDESSTILCRCFGLEAVSC
jgi:hypothetical protein